MASTSHKKSRAKPKPAKRVSKPRAVPKTAHRAKPRAPARKARPVKKVVPKKASPKKPAAAKPKIEAKPAPRRKGGPVAPAPTPVVPRSGDGRRHVLSLSFLRDGDEFLARIETDAGQITEFKHRVLDQLLSLVASELEDLLE